MRVVGLTGGIATGKSTVAQLIRDRGVPVLDADQAARTIVQPGQPALKALADAFGEHILQADGQLDRKALRQRIAVDPDARKVVNGITHPAIHALLAEQLASLAAQGEPVALVEAALMVETGSYRTYAALVVVSCAPETQLRRVLARDDTDEATARGLLAAQLPLADKEAVADVVIRNDGSLQELEAAVDAAWGTILGESAAVAPTST